MGLTCNVCNKPNPEHIFHCAEHYKCDGCGTTEGLCSYVDRLVCDPCNDIEMQKRIEAFDGDTECTSEAVCPHCGKECRDSWELVDGAIKCGDCGNEFLVTREVEVTYSTSKGV